MEYADGGTLRNYLKERFSNLTWNDKLNMALQLAHAVSCLHDEGVVHRDLVIHHLHCFTVHFLITYSIINHFFLIYSTPIMY